MYSRKTWVLITHPHIRHCLYRTSTENWTELQHETILVLINRYARHFILPYKNSKFTHGWPVTACVLFAFPITPVQLRHSESSQYAKFCLARRPYGFQRLWYNLCIIQQCGPFDYTAYCIGQHLIRWGDLTLNQVKRTRFMFSINKLDLLVSSQSSKTNRFTKQKNL